MAAGQPGGTLCPWRLLRGLDLKLNGEKADEQRTLFENVANISAFGVDPQNELYVLSLDRPISKIVAG